MFVYFLDELPSEITQHLQLFVEQRPDWTQERVMRSALALFLLQNGVRDQAVSQVYLQAMFPTHQSKRGGAQ